MLQCLLLLLKLNLSLQSLEKFWENHLHSPVYYPKPILVQYLWQNIHLMGRELHVNARTRFTNDMVQDGILKVIFIRSGDNPAD
jgi:hypothetical protein